MESLFEKQAREFADKYKNVKNPSPTKPIVERLFHAIGGFLFTIMTSAYGIFTHGFVGHKLWEWFVVPVFNVQPISILQAAGIMFLARLFTYENPFAFGSSLKGLDKTSTTVQIWALVLLPWLTLAMGYIVHRIIIA
jgi:hypothetical protein